MFRVKIHCLDYNNQLLIQINCKIKLPNRARNLTIIIYIIGGENCNKGQNFCLFKLSNVFNRFTIIVLIIIIFHYHHLCLVCRKLLILINCQIRPPWKPLIAPSPRADSLDLVQAIVINTNRLYQHRVFNNIIIMAK